MLILNESETRGTLLLDGTGEAKKPCSRYDGHRRRSPCMYDGIYNGELKRVGTIGISSYEENEQRGLGCLKVMTDEYPNQMRYRMYQKSRN